MTNVMMFPGVGSQYENMGNKIRHDEFAIKILKEASEIVDYDLVALSTNGGIHEMDRSEILHPLIVAYGYVRYQLVRKQIPVHTFVGHSLGEITALLSAGYISLEDAIHFAKIRGSNYDKALNIGEVAIVIGIQAEVLNDILAKVKECSYISITAYNTQTQFMICGTKEAIVKTGELLKATQAMFVPTSVLPMRKSVPVHSALMKSVIKDKMQFGGQIKMNDHIVYSSVTGKRYFTEQEIQDNLSEQLYKPVLWYQTIYNIMQSETNCFIDAGPQRILKDFLIEIEPNQRNLFALDVNEDYNKLIAV